MTLLPSAIPGAGGELAGVAEVRQEAVGESRTTAEVIGIEKTSEP